ncbi:branched-chain amino acid ABC transporter permease [Pseudoclavibacter soli]|uniref:branched-chain amino acid ABC transporter permease n=1 Tax=Pseudoclavibacter soli TaxID=452623 RepID=UPI00040B952A|nr:branched-chain amino acid ABC transporter permease [Pseudoclavibacter soli]
MDFSFLTQALGEAISPTTAAYALAALGLTVHFGYTGLLNFGQAGFMAVGAYGFAITSNALGAPFFLALLFSLIGAVVFALLLGIPTLRLRADYLSIVTIGAAEIIRLVAKTPELSWLTGGSAGLDSGADSLQALSPVPKGLYGIGSLTLTDKDVWVMIVAWSIVALAVLFVWRLIRSPWGRVVKAIREDEDAVRSLGKNVFAYKMQVLIVGGVLGGLGGMIFVLPRSVQPDNFGTQTTFFLWTIMLLGGAATVLGPIVGSMIFWVVIVATDGIVSELISNDLLPITGVQGGQIRFILVGLALMLLVIFRPQGIFGKKSEVYFNA